MENQVFWLNYLFFVDFTPDRDEIAAIPVGPLSAESASLLAASLSSRDGGEYRGEWAAAGESAYSLEGAEVTHNGANSLGFPSNALYANVLMLKFADARTASQLVLHYN